MTMWINGKRKRRPTRAEMRVYFWDSAVTYAEWGHWDNAVYMLLLMEAE